MTMEPRGRVVIVGGGITGLAAALYLRQHAPDLALTLLESDNRLGGKISTTRADGFVIEGGPDSFLSYKARGLGLCRELGLESRLQGTSGKVRRTYILRDDRLYQLPEGLTGLIPSRFGPMTQTPLISPWGKLRMGLEYFVPPRMTPEDESLGAFVSRRLGREVYERLIEPLMSGIYAGDGNQLSLNATFPNLRKAEVEHGGLIKSMLNAKRTQTQDAPSSTAKKWPAFLTLQNGLGELVDAIVAQLKPDVDIRLATRVTGITRGEHSGYRLEIENEEPLQAEAVILTTPAFATAEIMEPIDAPIADALRHIPYASSATVSVAYPLAQAQVRMALDAHGYIVPRREGHPVLACTWTSTKFPHRAPEGYALIRAFLGRAGQDDIVERSDEELVQLARDELKTVMGITATPQMQFVFRWRQAMPQYTLGHLDRVKLIEQRINEQPGLFCAGAAFRGIGIPDCIASGERAAAQTLGHLKTQPNTGVIPA